jgi:hypothetical protein
MQVGRWQTALRPAILSRRVERVQQDPLALLSVSATDNYAEAVILGDYCIESLSPSRDESFAAERSVLSASIAERALVRLDDGAVLAPAYAFFIASKYMEADIKDKAIIWFARRLSMLADS